MDKLVIIFVEGETDEVFFKQLLLYYSGTSKKPLSPYKICNLRGITRYSSKLLAKLKNDFLPASRQNSFTINAVCCSYDTDVFDAGNPMIVNWGNLRRSVLKIGVKEFVQLGIKRSIEDWILCDISGICRFLKLNNIPKSLKGADGNAKLTNLYSLANKVYQKGYQATALISALNMAVIREKNRTVLEGLEKVLGVYFEE
ncbi:MAG: hypothetical protein J6T09_00910 [Bacteroidales bacterium]|nr:hypothetical protein [Bacteroidales bacterium]